MTQSNLANSYHRLGRTEEAITLRRGVYSGYVKLLGEQNSDTLSAALNYASCLNALRRFEEAKQLLRKTMPVARRILGESNDLTLKMRWSCARALYNDPGATLDDLREAATTLEDIERTARRVLGGAHPTTTGIEKDLQIARAALRTCEKKAEKSAEEVD